MNLLLVLIGGAAGASARFLIDRAVQRGQATEFPWGTFAANTLGCLLVGVLTGAVLAQAATERVYLLVGTGLCGALTTYSTFAWETVHLARSGQTVRAAGSAASTVLAGLGAVLIGLTAARVLWP
ncbi:fluoride efflux transporter CrcB [Streptomyces marincola]|uniref:fluoride efflux transporter CrcB n=1 Tax=Streptomyces marincola TaxID=2878388 RepID=UPI001CF1352A|nr:fluoride efflux transporter CrcB [Streptomyces marincola]UCM89913.1 fluoride efflux transporter CrcB [Streptomyces marincola]